MSLQQSQKSSVEHSAAHHASKTSLHGRWLFMARMGWIALTLLVLTLNTIAIPHYYALTQTVCRPGTSCILGLTHVELRQLRQLGLSPEFLTHYQIGWDVGTTLIYTALAALIFWRRSADRMALFCAYMLVLFGGATYTDLLDIGLRTLAPIWFWLVGGLELLAQVCVPTFFLLFPTGRFVPRWSRWIVLVIILYEVWYVFLSDAYLGQNNGLGALVFAALILCLVGLQIYRYRRVSSYPERQQTKWVVFGIALALGGLALFLIIANLFHPLQELNSSAAGNLVPTTVTDGQLLFIPISIAIAILRSRLYDIDTIINKALVYGLLSVLLVVVYAGLIFAIQFLLREIINQNNDVAIVISTLVIAALFQPLRRRIQEIIDRRFYRRKYDAAQIVEAFSVTLRNEVDLNELREHLITVVQDTMQPSHISLWLREPSSNPPRLDRMPPT
jgi:hypothetical protein